MLRCDSLVKIYSERRVVDDLSFWVEEGEVFALLGSNGAGKTTTIKMILGLIKRDGGEIERDNKRVGYSPETPYFPQFMTAREVLSYYGRIQKMSKAELDVAIPDLLERVGLEDTKTRVRNFSKGMLQRLALAQALLGDPELLILDEPTAGLDALGRVEMMRTIRRLKGTGKTIIINSHILHDIETVCDRGIIINKGRKVYDWTNGAEERSLEEIFLEQIGGEE